MPFPDQPENTPIPPELDRWNWGAFFLNWVWGIGNSTYIALLMFVPLLNVVMIFVLGAKGSQWAWKNRVWANEEHFKRTQRNWARAGLAVWGVLILLLGLGVHTIFSAIRGSDAYQMSMALVLSDDRVAAAIGQPIETGWFTTGSIHISGPSGRADLAIPITGPKCSGTVYSRATKTAGTWKLTLLAVRSDCEPDPIVLIDKGHEIGAGKKIKANWL